MRRLAVFAILSLIIAVPRLFAQQSNPDPYGVGPIIQGIIREKIHVPPERIEEMLRGVGATDSVAVTMREAISKTLDQDEVLVSGDAIPESEVHAAINPADSANIVVSAMHFEASNPNGGLLCPVFFTRDFGRTWAKSSFVTKPAESGALIMGGGDPMFAFAADGTLYFSWIHLYILGGGVYMAMYWASSTDGGETWSRAANDLIGRARVSLSGGGTEMFDKEWLAVDRTQSPYRNTLYAAFYHPTIAAGVRIALRKKSPDSAAFTQSSVIVNSPGYKFLQFTSIAIDPAGGVHVTFFGSKDSLVFALYHALSVDGGASFLPETKISDVNFPRFSANDRTGVILGLQDTRIYPCPHVAIDPVEHGGRVNVYAIWTSNGVTTKEPNGCDIRFSRSEDNGATWSAPLVVNDDPAGLVRDQFHGSLALNTDGVVAVTWYDRRDDPANLDARYMIALSFDGGRTFTPNVPVSSAVTDFATAGSMNNGFAIGEYNQVLMTRSYAIPVWSDARAGNGNLDVYAAFVPLAAPNAVERVADVADDFSLTGAAPNPFAGSTAVAYRIGRATDIRLEIRDALGRLVRTLVDGREDAGEHRATFDAAALPAGTYYATLTTSSGRATAAVTLVR